MKEHLELRGWNLQAQTRLFYIAIEIYWANNLGSNHASFSMASREALEGLWSALPLSSGLFPRTPSVQPDLREGSGRDWACLHQKMEKLKAFNPYILGKSRSYLFAMTPKAIKTKIRVGIHLSFAFLAAWAMEINSNLKRGNSIFVGKIRSCVKTLTCIKLNYFYFCWQPILLSELLLSKLFNICLSNTAGFFPLKLKFKVRIEVLYPIIFI